MSRAIEHSSPDLFTARPRESLYPAGVPIDVCDLFEKLALDLHAKGFDYYSARDITARMRWHHQVEGGNREFRINNVWSPALARWFMAKHPEVPNFFETREVGE